MEYRIIWRNTATKEVFVRTDTDQGGKLFYRFFLPMGLSKGEYEYFITSAEGTLVLNENDPRKSTIDGVQIPVYDCGVAQVGRIERTGMTYYDITKVYEQYES